MVVAAAPAWVHTVKILVFRKKIKYFILFMNVDKPFCISVSIVYFGAIKTRCSHPHILVCILKFDQLNKKKMYSLFYVWL